MDRVDTDGCVLVCDLDEAGVSLDLAEELGFLGQKSASVFLKGFVLVYEGPIFALNAFWGDEGVIRIG